MINATAAVIRSEIVDGRAALIELGAEPAPLFRPPYGDLPPILPEIARAAGVRPITWDAALGDPDPDRTAELMERDAIRWVQAGSIIIMHINGRGYGTAETVPPIAAIATLLQSAASVARCCGGIRTDDGTTAAGSAGRRHTVGRSVTRGAADVDPVIYAFPAQSTATPASDSPCTARAVAPIGAAVLGNSCSSSRPTMSATS